VYIAIAVGVLIASFLVQVLPFGPRQFRKRASFLAEYTAKKGYRLANPAIAQITGASSARAILTDPALKSYAKGSEGIGDIDGLEGGTDDPFAVTCRIRSKDAMIFELRVPSRRTDAQGQALHYKVAKITSEGLPRFSLGRQSVANTVANVVEKMVGKATPTIALDERNFPQFAKQYWVKSPDNGAVLAFLSAEKMTFLENSKLPGTIATNSHYFVYFESGSLRTEQQHIYRGGG
jgi:hypothetical protein